MIGPRIGPRAGRRVGPAVGPGADPLAPSSSAAPETTLTVTIADSADPVITSVNFDYSTIVTNTGAITATDVVCTITLDQQLTHVSTSGTGWTIDTSALPVITCTRATLVVGAAPTITTTVTSPAAAETSSTTAGADASNSPVATPDTETTVVNLVSRDATSLKRVPASVAEWNSLISYFGLSTAAPDSIFLMQEASGNLADSGSAGLTLTANAAPLYAQAIAGWTRTAVGTADATANQRFRSLQTALPNVLTESMLVLGYVAVTNNPAAARGVIGIGLTQTEMRAVTSGGTTYLARCIGGGSTATSATESGVGVRPCVVQIDRTASAQRFYSDQETLSPTFGGTQTGEGLDFGATVGSPPATARYLYAAAWFLSNAEMSSANVKAMLQALGWTVTGY